jgi:PAS domain S-box-containing protein
VVKKLYFLLLEDNPPDVDLIRTALTESGMEFELKWVKSRLAFLHALKSDSVDLILSDYSLPNFDGITALGIAQDTCPEVPFIFVSASLGEELAIETLKHGATDYVLKHRLGRLVPSVQRALRETKERRERKQALEELQVALEELRVVEEELTNHNEALEQQNQELTRQGEALQVARQAAEAERQRYQDLFELAPDGYLVTDMTGTIQEANRAAANLLNVSERLLIGSQLLNFVVESERAAFEAQLHQPWREEWVREWESCLNRQRQDQPIDVVLKVAAIRDRAGRLTGGMRWLLRDVSRRKEAEKALQERNERLNLLFETTRDLLSTEQPLPLMHSVFAKLSAQMEIDSYFVFLVKEKDNRQMLQLTSYVGISEETAKTLKWIEFGELLWGQVAQNRCQIVVNDVQRSPFPNIELFRSLGILAFAGQPLIVQGRLLGTLSFASSSRKCLTPDEVALLQAASDQVAVAIDRANLVTSLQQQTEQLSQANRIKDEFLAVLSHELRTPLNPILGWTSILRSRQCDAVTTARALEIIERNAKIQIQLIEDLLDVSRILQGKVSLAMAPVDLAKTIEAALETVQLAAKAKSITLQFAILDSGSKNIEPDIHHYFENSLDFEASENNDQAKVKVSFNLNTQSQAQNSKFQVLGDANRLQQVIWNLLSNAVKFTPLGGRVDVSLSVIKEGEERADESGSAVEQPSIVNHSSPQALVEYVQIQVRDTGEGISSYFLPHVFDYFRQADGSTTRTFGGLGLGLAIAHHLIQLHGGTIQADSPGTGQGATFSVRLPLLKGDEGGGIRDENHFSHFPSPQPRSISLSGLRILIVDDEKDTLEFIQFLLEQYGGVVMPAASGAEAFSALKQWQPDVLLSDIAMPEEDGFMLLHRVRALGVEAGGNIPAIALTAHAREEDRERALSGGFQKYLAKPIKPSDLIATVAEVAGRFNSD